MEDSDNWVALEIPPETDIAVLKKNLLSILSPLEFFTPHITYIDNKGCGTTKTLFDGYVFVRGNFTNNQYLRLVKSPYILQILSQNKNVKTITNKQIEEWKSKLSNDIPLFTEGDIVCSTQGPFRGMRSKLVSLTEIDACIEVSTPFKSAIILTHVPRVTLKKFEED